ncbi:MAG: phage tail tip lysozyme [Clostridia bacterium]|nr:phage tail tip lysozyme [Clostridia bacterium]
MNFKKRVLVVILSLILVAAPLSVFGSAANLVTCNNAKIIFDFLVDDMGLNSAAACGVLANIEAESNFNPNLTGDNGTSYGICQWHAGRFDNLKSYCEKNGYNYKTIEGQLKYLQYELTNNKSDTGNILERLKVDNTEKGAYTAGYNWCYYFERPANKADKSVTRGNNAKNNYWPVYKIVYTLGDVNSDGGVNSTDALIVLSASLNKIELTRSQAKAADWNCDGKVDSTDALMILRTSVSA